MSSKIEQLIDEIEEYIDGCKYKPFNNEIIMVNKSEIDELLRELRMKTPDEIKRYQKVISNKEAILNDAKEKAQELINEATIQTNELINEHQIMQQAYAQANEIIELATRQAHEILDAATIESNELKSAATKYADDMLANLEGIINHTIEVSSRDSNTMITNLSQLSNIVAANRTELYPEVEDTQTTSAEETNAEAV